MPFLLQVVIARVARGCAARMELQRSQIDRPSKVGAGIVHFDSSRLFCRHEYYVASFSKQEFDNFGFANSHSNLADVGIGDGSTTIPNGEFEYFDESMSKEQLTALDGIVAMGIGFARYEHSVRGANDIAFYCYHGRATPSQFPPASGSVTDGLEARLRQEMRGLAVDRSTRRVLSRPFHKHWHAGQRTEQAKREVAELLAVPALPLIEKIGGVQVQAFLVDSRVYLATRSGRTNAAIEAESLLRGEQGQRWVQLAAVAINAGFTPLLEFCSPALNRNLNEASLVLIALRHRATGAYMPYVRVAHLAWRFGVRVVHVLATWTPTMANPPLPNSHPCETLAHLVDSMQHTVRAVASTRPVEACMLMLPSGLILKVVAHTQRALLAAHHGSSHGAVPLETSSTPSLALYKHHVDPWRSLSRADSRLVKSVQLLIMYAAESVRSVSPSRLNHWTSRVSPHEVALAAKHIVMVAIQSLTTVQASGATFAWNQVLIEDAVKLCQHIAHNFGTPLHTLDMHSLVEVRRVLEAEVYLTFSNGAAPEFEEEDVKRVEATGGNRQGEHWTTDLLCGLRNGDKLDRVQLSQEALDNSHHEMPHEPKKLHATRATCATPVTQNTKHSSSAFETPLLASILAGVPQYSGYAFRRRNQPLY